MTFSLPTVEFSEKFSKKYGKAPEIPAGAGYDTVYAYAKAIQAANTFDPIKVIPEMLKLRFQGASGEITLDPDGCVVKPIRLWKIEQGKFAAIDLAH